MLMPPAPWKPLNPPRKTEVLDDSNLESGARNLLTFEHPGGMLDATQMEISLYKPEMLRVSRERYDQMVEELDNAFLRPQLWEYYSEFVSRAPEKAIVPLRKTAKKAQVLNMILRGLWGIEVTDEIAQREDVLITREIASRKRDLFFMIGEDGHVLRSWAQNFMTRITVNVAKSTMQFRGSLANIERLSFAMDEMLKMIITEDIDLSWTSKYGSFAEDYVTPIARLTHTFIEKVDETTIRVMALGPERQAIDDARRLLYTSLNMQIRSIYSLVYNAPRDHDSLKGALYPFSEDPSLPWAFRGRDWARWRNVRAKPNPAIQEEPKPDETEQQDTIKMKGERSLGALENIRQILDQSPIAEVAVGERPVAEYQAILGCILHDSEGNAAPQSPQTLEEFIKDERPRILSNEFPGVSFIAQAPVGRKDTKPAYKDDAAKLVDNNITYSFSVRFAASPWSLPTTFEQYPILELTAPIDRYTGHILQPTLIARNSESVADMLMPNRQCDLRFLRRMDVPLALGTGGERTVGGITNEELERFKKNSNLDLSGKSRLGVVPTIKASIPQWMMQHVPDLPTVDVEYLFVGLEFKRELNFDWRGLQLRHTVIDGGASGGKRTEVKLICKPASETEGVLDVKTDEEMLRTQDAVEQRMEREAEVKELVAESVKWEEEEIGTSEEEVATKGNDVEPVAEVKELDDQVEEVETAVLRMPTEISDSSFSEFVKSTMALVKSLESRITRSTTDGNGILR